MNKQVWAKIARMYLCIFPFAVIGGFTVGIYTLEHATDEAAAQILQQMGSLAVVYMVTTLQSVIYSIFATVIGYLLAGRIGLIKPFCFEASKLKKTLPIIVLLGVIFSCDYFVVGQFIPEVAADYEAGISPAYFITSLTYGGVIEEVLMRWFLMSFFAWMLVMFFARKSESIPEWIFITANILAALLFAAGHLPATLAFFGSFTPLILARCFLLNGGFALVFGRYYRKYGIQYAMLAHFGVHLVSKLILIAII